MRIRLVTPAPRRSRSGNRVTALRWARCLRVLGHDVDLSPAYDGGGGDALVALHAVKSADSVARFRAERPDAPIVLALTGTDVYGDDPATEASAALADRLVVLQPLARTRLPEELRPKTRVIYQSAPRPAEPPEPATAFFDVAVLAHLRRVKDPFRAAHAARLLPESSRVRIVHAGAALEPDLSREAAKEMAANPRYVWRGDVPRREALRTLAVSRLAVISSLAEGGANVVSEAAAASVPLLASRIDGTVGLLGEDYPGYFPVGDTRALSNLLLRAESDPVFLRALRDGVERSAPLFSPEREIRSWESLIAEIQNGSRAT